MAVEHLKKYNESVKGKSVKPKRNPLEKSWDNHTSMRYAINAMCFECNGGELWVDRTRNCQIVSCPLHRFRPHQVKEKTNE